MAFLVSQDIRGQHLQCLDCELLGIVGN